MRVYFAHSKLDYNSKREEEATLFIKRQIPSADIICPNQDIGECSKGMIAYRAIVSWAEQVVVLEHDKTVGRGVYEEVIHALNAEIPVVAIRKNKLVPIKKAIILDCDSWRNGYAELKELV